MKLFLTGAIIYFLIAFIGGSYFVAPLMIAVLSIWLYKFEKVNKKVGDE